MFPIWHLSLPKQKCAQKRGSHNVLRESSAAKEAGKPTTGKNLGQVSLEDNWSGNLVNKHSNQMRNANLSQASR
jgi:hypothetical protein